VCVYLADINYQGQAQNVAYQTERKLIMPRLSCLLTIRSSEI